MEFPVVLRGFLRMSTSPSNILSHVLNHGLLFAAIGIATGSKRFQIARFESQGQKNRSNRCQGFTLLILRSRFQIERFDSLAIWNL